MIKLSRFLIKKKTKQTKTEASVFQVGFVISMIRISPLPYKMASHALAQMLDELMGKDRNLAPTEKRDQVHWSDPDVRIF